MTNLFFRALRLARRYPHLSAGNIAIIVRCDHATARKALRAAAAERRHGGPAVVVSDAELRRRLVP